MVWDTHTDLVSRNRECKPTVEETPFAIPRHALLTKLN